MKQLLRTLGAIACLLLPAAIRAEEGWRIDDFHSLLTLKENGVVEVAETIAVDFAGQQKHGIYRDLPYVYLDSQGGKTYTTVKVVDVRQNQEKARYKVEYGQANLRIRIGDPDKTVSGRQTYQLTYTVVGALTAYGTYDELYWNVTGNDWAVPIEHASATVRLPKDGIEQTSCYEGPVGSQQACTMGGQTPSQVDFTVAHALSAGQGLTVAVGYTKGLLPILKGEPPPTVANRLFSLPSLLAFVLVTVPGWVLVARLWWRKGRDSRFSRDDEDGEEELPLGVREVAAVEFAPPFNLRPAEIGTLLDEGADTRDVSATVIDLASRGFLTVTEEPTSSMLGMVKGAEYTLVKTDKPWKGLLGYEQKLLEGLFTGRESVKVSELQDSFYKTLEEVKGEMYEEMVRKQYFTANPHKVRIKYLLIALGFGVLAWLLFVQAVALMSGILFGLAAAIGALGVTVLLLVKAMPKRTAAGREAFRQSKGYELFITKAERYRQQFFEKENLFTEVLPYAVMFGVAQKFAKALKDMGVPVQQPAWYTGTHAFNPVAFGTSMNSLSRTLSTSMASRPSSSGSGGGGFSGGGFGGGGGGSW